MNPLIVAALLLAGAAGWPQEPLDEKPARAAPEPERQPRASGESFVLTGLLYDQSVEGVDRSTVALPELVRFFNKATKLKIEILWNERTLSNPRLAEAALLYLTGDEAPLRFDEEERKRLGEYLLRGGLLFAEDVRLEQVRGRRTVGDVGVAGTPFDQQLKTLVRDPLVLGSQGARWESIPKGHPLFSSYFDFLDGPPLAGAQRGDVRELEMVQVRGRVAVIFSDLNISARWGNMEAQGRQRYLQFGVNLIVFAMTQRAGGL